MRSGGDFRQRARDEVERLWPNITKALEDAVAAETTKYGDCPKCGKRVPVTFPDYQGRVKAMKFLIEAGHGKPPETIEVTVGLEADLQRWQGYLERMTKDEREVMLGFLRREEGLQPALPVGEAHEDEDEDADDHEPVGSLSANGVTQEQERGP